MAPFVELEWGSDAYQLMWALKRLLDPQGNQIWLAAERERRGLLTIRKDTFPAVGAVRKTGTTVIIEDVTFPVEQLAIGVNRLIELFDKQALERPHQLVSVAAPFQLDKGRHIAPGTVLII